MRRGASWVTILITILIGCVVGISAGVFLAWWVPLSRATHTGIGDLFNKNPFGNERYVRILMIGADDTGNGHSENSGLSDTLVAMCLDTTTKEVRAISIPRDTMVDIPGRGTHKINAGHAIGGPQMTKSVVESLLGVKMNYYVKITTSGLVKLVDKLGGVYIIVDKNMKYTDRHAKLYINLKASPEKQLLNGTQAMGYVRFRHDAIGDSGFTMKDGKKVPAGRVVRQQYFLRALVNRILGLPTRRERAAVLQEAIEKKWIETDLNIVDWDAMSDFFKDIDPEKMVTDMLPGGAQRVHGASYWMPDQAEIVKIVNQNMYFQGNLNEPAVKVEVLNGSGTPGLAKDFADKLSKLGNYDIVKTENAKSFDYIKSQIIDRKNRSKAVEEITKSLGSAEYKKEPGDKDSKVDITVIIGKEYIRSSIK